MSPLRSLEPVRVSRQSGWFLSNFPGDTIRERFTPSPPSESASPARVSPFSRPVQLRAHIQRFPSGFYRGEANGLLVARRVSEAEIWKATERHLALFQPEAEV